MRPANRIQCDHSELRLFYKGHELLDHQTLAIIEAYGASFGGSEKPIIDVRLPGQDIPKALDQAESTNSASPFWKPAFWIVIVLLLATMTAIYFAVSSKANDAVLVVKSQTLHHDPEDGTQAGFRLLSPRERPCRRSSNGTIDAVSNDSHPSSENSQIVLDVDIDDLCWDDRSPFSQRSAWSWTRKGFFSQTSKQGINPRKANGAFDVIQTLIRNDSRSFTCQSDRITDFTNSSRRNVSSYGLRSKRGMRRNQEGEGCATVSFRDSNSLRRDLLDRD